MIFVGVRDDLGVEPGHPKGQTKPRTVRDTIGHLPRGEPGEHSPDIITAWKKSRPGQFLRKAVRFVGSFQSCRLDPNRPSMTQIKAHRHWHYAVPRHLTNLEAALLGSFPEEYKWTGTKYEIQQRIGNSVPPNFMRAIAEHINENILQRMTDMGLKPKMKK